MLLKRAVGLGSLAVVGMALALAPAQVAGAQRVSRAASTDLVPRTPPPRTPTAQLQLPAAGTGSIIFQFRDPGRAPGTAGGIAALGGLGGGGGCPFGRSGGLVLQHDGTLEGGTAKIDWLVVPGSGTGELSGLRGEGSFAVGHAAPHAVTLDFDFE